MATIIQLRRDTASRWASTNPTLAEGEAGVETDTGKLKIGDGLTAWNSLSYFTGDAPVKSVNSKTGAVTLNASDVGAVSDVTVDGTSVVQNGVAVLPEISTDYSDMTNKPQINSTTLSGNKSASDLGLQEALVSGTNLKTINSTSLLGSGDVAVQETLVSGTNLKTINSTSLLGSGDVAVQEPLVSGTNLKTINSTSLLGSGDVALPSDVQVNGTSVVSGGVANIPVASTDDLGVIKLAGQAYGLDKNVNNALVIAGANEAQIDAKTNGYKPIVPATLNYAVRSVFPACTTITAADTTATLRANTTYAHQPTTGCTYTLTTPADLTVYSGFILMLDTANSASIAFQTDDSPATSIVLNGNPTIATGKKYTVTGQYSVLNNAWELWIIEYSAT